MNRAAAIRATITGAAALLLVAGCTACSSSSSTTSAGSGAGAGSSASASASAADSGGPSAAPAAASGSTDPCTLATTTEIQAIFGGTVATGAPDTDPSQVNPTCVWPVTGSNLGGSGQVDIFLPTAMQDATKFGYAKDGTPGAIDLPGIGDSAFYSAQTDAVTFASGDTVVTVQSVFIRGDGNTLDPATTQQQVTALATKVAAGL
ncbi:DUF3558 family protein [Subtercola endophyticus]|uniref:DUF3558 family protein n=1 Tax=Subtercola endophyticus TaxID=2895559 RepID=UPI001E4CFE72|nr:DUF3558 family protein [Subtercola endophyticus]UFS61009.1 DUF3558 family protein [Subtercola endophyticus]